MTDQNLALLVVLDNSSRTNLEAKKRTCFLCSSPSAFLKALYRVVLPSLRYPPIYTAKRTTSKESSRNLPEHLDFYIVIIIVKHVMGCFEIGSVESVDFEKKKNET